MNKLTQYQTQIYDKLLPELGKTKPYKEVYRLSLLYRQNKEIEKNIVLLEKFRTIINNSLYFHLKTKEEFYDLDKFKDIYKTLLEEFILDNIDADENDFVQKYINSQQEIIEKKFNYFIEIDGYESLELIQFVEKDFFEEFIRSSKKKIEFLNSLSIVKEGSLGIKYDNPYPEYFQSYGYELYKEFTSTINKQIVLAEMSFLVDKLRKDGLMNKDKSLSNIFKFMIEEFDTNFGTATKFKSDYSTDKHLQLYKMIKKRYDIIPS
ncbi:hypothetical protein [Aurantibacter sp.]|uniref:hypothetical protein n=1 Tax=Aurantibacter sp. TaxID=2807103 RepID=UPI0035C87271